jgi:integrase
MQLCFPNLPCVVPDAQAPITSVTDARARALAMLVAPLSASQSFTEAAASFLDSRATINARRRIQYVKPRTTEGYEEQLHMAGQYFGDMKLTDIKPEDLRGYQLARTNGGIFMRRVGKYKQRQLVPTQCGSAKVNRELGLVKRIMLEAGAWTPQLNAAYLRLDEPDNDIQRALSREEQEVFLAVAESRPEWEVIFWYSLVAEHTTFSTDEMRTLRQGDINLPQQILSVNRQFGKNKRRRRVVPITDGRAMWALEQLLERSIRMVGRNPMFYLFPLCLARNQAERYRAARLETNCYDGMEPMSRTGLRKPFEEVRQAAGLAWFKLNGWRHTAITNLASEGVPIAVIMEMAGHISPKMTQHYTHISQQVVRQHRERSSARRPPLPERLLPQHRQWGVA